jgi:hypothetical protein
MKTAVLLSGLLLILLANLIMVYYTPYGLSPMEGYQNPTMMPPNATMAPPPSATMAPPPTPPTPKAPARMTEGFSSYYLENAGGAKETYSPVGAFDGVKLSTGNSVSGWRYTAPNEPLMGAEFQPGADSLFMFKNNQCKPECCGASFSCGGGCVCTTPQQRQYIAARGGNRTEPEDSA